MKNKHSKLIPIILFMFIMSLLLVACGGDDPEPAPPAEEPAAEVDTTEEEADEEEPAEEEAIAVDIVTTEEEPAEEAAEEEVAEEAAEEEMMSYNESPLLADMVASGDLPPVEERLPINPRVLPVYEEIGQYGGTWRRAYNGITDRWGPTKLQEERIIEFYANADGSIELVANWADEFIISEDARDFTFHIREGMKWSDGVPVTTEDVRFWYEDIFLTTLFRSAPPQNLTTNGNPMVIEIVDDFTFIVQFTDPYPLFPFTLAKESTGAPGLTRDSFLLPAHYLKDYHPNYVPEEDLNVIAEEWALMAGSTCGATKGQSNPGG